MRSWSGWEMHVVRMVSRGWDDDEVERWVMKMYGLRMVRRGLGL